MEKYKQKLERQHTDVEQALDSLTVTVHLMLYGDDEEKKREGAGLPNREEIRSALNLAYTVDSVLRRDDEVKGLLERFGPTISGCYVVRLLGGFSLTKA